MLALWILTVTPRILALCLLCRWYALCALGYGTTKFLLWFFLLAIMGLLFYLQFKYIHNSLMPVDVIGNQGHHTISRLNKNALPIMGNQGLRIWQKIRLPIVDISIYYPLFFTLKNINISANKKFKHQQRELQMTSVGFT